MKKHWYRVLCMGMAILMLVCLASCTVEEEENTSVEISIDPDAAYKDDKGLYVPRQGVIEAYKGNEFHVLVPGEGQGTYQSDDFTTEAGNGGINYGDTFYNEIKKRNDWAMENYGLEVVPEKVDGVLAAAQNDDATGMQQYDALVCAISDLTPLTQKSTLVNLRDLQNFDENSPWWDASANAAYSISQKLYFTTGDITIMNKANVWSIMFNKQMVKDNNLDSPYELFDNGTWTFDKMVEMARQVNTYGPTVNVDTDDFIVGMVTDYNDMLRFYGGSGKLLCSKDANDIPQLEFGSAHDAESITLSSKLLATFAEAEWRYYAQEYPGTDKWGNTFNWFKHGKALFRPSGFTAVTKCRLEEGVIDFGIVPMPKMTDTQEEYTVTSSGSFAAAIMKSCKDPEYSAYALEVFAAGAKNYVTPAYIDVNLIAKSLKDAESEKCLEYIFSHITYDVGFVYNFGEGNSSISGLYSSLASNKSSDISSGFEGIRGIVEQKIADFVDIYNLDV